ncbi:hypothetical protein [uncultured Mailhella sp.]|uniref:hypothetical protein n=1 Tax=uncultured Mailhella sp. TaxID=1981031 RepID=UPI0025D7D426|nr:hypothetical protein [uncultured Mailhella sp.]
MVPLFSASPFELGEVSVHAELEFLPDQELMSLWEQTQLAMAAIEGNGGSAKMAHAYEYAVLMEMQRRLAGRSARELFGSDDVRMEYDAKRSPQAELKG